MSHLKRILGTGILLATASNLSFAYAGNDNDFNPNSFIQQQSAIMSGEQVTFDHMANGPLALLQTCIKNHFSTNDCDSTPGSSGSGGGFGAESNADSMQAPTALPNTSSNSSSPTNTTNTTSTTTPKQSAPALPITNEQSKSITWNYHL